MDDHSQALEMYRKSLDWRQALASSRLLGYSEDEFTKLVQALCGRSSHDDRGGHVFKSSSPRHLGRFRLTVSYPPFFHLELVDLKDRLRHSEAAFLQLFYTNVRFFD